MENKLIDILNTVADCENFQILECNTDKDYVHLLIDCSPQHYIPNIIQKLKGVSSRLFMKEFGMVLKRNYMVDICGIQVILWQLYQKIQKNKLENILKIKKRK